MFVIAAKLTTTESYEITEDEVLSQIDRNGKLLYKLLIEGTTGSCVFLSFSSGQPCSDQGGTSSPDLIHHLYIFINHITFYNYHE